MLPLIVYSTSAAAAVAVSGRGSADSGAAVGTAVGATVGGGGTRHSPGSIGSATKPSRHTHRGRGEFMPYISFTTHQVIASSQSAANPCCGSHAFRISPSSVVNVAGVGGGTGASVEA
jgi:hypothetical protein